MKKTAFILLSLLPLNSCQASFAFYRKVNESNREEALSSYFSAIGEYEIEMPDEFSFTQSYKQGYEEDRNPLFGEVIYKKTNSFLTKTIDFDLSSYTYRYYEYSYTRVEVEEEDSASEESPLSSSEESTSAKMKEKLDSSSLEIKASLVGTSLVYSVTSKKDGEIVAEETEKDEYDSANDAKEAFKSFSKDYVSEEFSSNASIFYDLIEVIPSFYNEDTPELYDYNVYRRTGFEKDFKINLIRYGNEEKKLALDYYLAEAQDYLPHTYRSINRGYSEGETLVTESNITLVC
ncbi:MAG: hypothetical protein K6B65_02420 [Bacilli bacterium]|nr:hypothetical protein [Bacilli bacterium]